jgi:type II secretory pathway component GspD/PulD (secretin)
MARKYIGLPLGGMIALCAILLLAPDTRGQQMKVMKKRCIISGTVGASGVSMVGFPVSPAPTTDENGVYSVEVDYGWSGTVKPVRSGYTFLPPEKTYTKVSANLTKEDYKPAVLTYTISGSVGLPGVKIVGFPEDVISDQVGRYTATVVYGWGAVVVPEKPGYRFEPSNKSYSQVTKDAKEENYKSYDLMFTISGTANAEGVVMKGLPNDPVTGLGGAYRVDVRYGWTGKVKPTKEGVQFTPEERSYPAVMENQTNQDYTARVFTYQISGTTGMAGVIMKGLPEDPITDNNGYYSATIQHGWIGKVTPEKPGYKFEPVSRDYPKVTASRENQDYKASVIFLTISGNAGSSNVTLSGLPGDPQGDTTGAYVAKVEYGWSGTVAPKKDGWYFEPASREYSSLAADQLKQDFKAQLITYKISGNVGMAQVTLQGLPGSIVSGQDGSYSVDVGYKWTGTVIPRKDGYTFEPASREYKELEAPQPSQDYKASVMQHTVLGRILDDAGKPVEGVFIMAEPSPGDGGPTTTNANGQFELKVNHRWQGKITFQKDGFTFNPPTRSFQPVFQNTPEQTATAKIKMLTITDRIVFTGGPADEPIAGVKVTAIPPGNNTVVTDTNGKYTVKVPYGWTGILRFEKDEFVFDPNKKDFTNVTQDVDNISPKTATLQPGPTVPPTQPSPAPTLQPGPVVPPTQPTLAPTLQPGPAVPPTQPAPAPVNDQAIRQEISRLTQEQNTLRTQINTAKQKGEIIPAEKQQRFNEIAPLLANLRIQLRAAAPASQETLGPGDIQTRQQGEALPLPPQGQGPIVGPLEPMPNLLNVLAELAKKTGVKIEADATVKGEPVPIALSSLDGLSVPQALHRIVTSTNPPYWFQMVDERTYKVYRPLTNSFPGGELIQALQDLSAAAGVTIIPDPNVTGTVSVSFENVSLDDALQMLLAGKPYVYKKMPQHYYLVGDRGILSRAFVDLSDTRRIRLNYTVPMRAKALLSPVFAQYVQAELPNARDANDQGNTLIVTAPAKLMDRIVDDIRQIDHYKRQVLLDARVVVMERGDLLNLGVEWGWPTMKAGVFTDRTAFSNGTSMEVSNGWPWGVQIGYAPDRTFTNSLMMALNLLQENSQADIIANPKVVAQDGRRAEMRVIQEEWFMMQATTTSNLYYSPAQLQKIESGTVLSITPNIGDNNDIMLHMAVEVSDSIPKARGSDLPLVTRRTAKNSVTVKDGGTVAVGGLTENRSKSDEKRVPGLSSLPLVGKLFQNKSSDKASREVAVFVTAHLVPEGTQVASKSASPGEISAAGDQAAGDDFRPELEKALARNR